MPVDEKVKRVLRENARLRRRLQERESGWEIIQGVLQEVYDAPSGLRVYKPASSRKAAKETALVHLTDLHYGKVTPTYNVSICEERMDGLCEAVQEIVALRRQTAAIDKCVLLLGGDMIEGEGIFGGQAWETEVDLVTQMVKEGPEVVANVLLFLLQHFREVEVHAVPGNHGRQAKFGSQTHNADSVFYEIVRMLTRFVNKNERGRIKWNLPLDRPRGDQWYARFPIVNRWGGMLVHGDQIRGQLGFPWYGYGKKVAGWRTAPATAGFQFLFSGHFHTHAAFDLHDCLVLSTGSPESTNAYALENMAASGSPKQRLCFFNERWGILADYPIHLHDRSE